MSLDSEFSRFDEVENLLKSSRSLIDEIVGKFVSRSESYSLLEFPDHSNVGDSAIWLGSVSCLEAHYGRSPAYVCTSGNFDPGKLASTTSGPIFLNGGGSLGDIWYESQIFKERVINMFPDRTVIQLPQSIHFSDCEKAQRAAKCFSSHKDFHLLVRDEISFRHAREILKIDAIICPDMALYLNQQHRKFSAPLTFLALLRADKESNVDYFKYSNLLDSIHRTDWLFELDVQTSYLRSNASALDNALAYKNIASARLDRGMIKLGLGKNVITDRLHAHILCLLLRIPHLIINNSYGKLHNFFRTWTSGISFATSSSNICDVGDWMIDRHRFNSDASSARFSEQSLVNRGTVVKYVPGDYSSLAFEFDVLEQKLVQDQDRNRIREAQLSQLVEGEVENTKRLLGEINDLAASQHRAWTEL
ncbi:exopolysaccharide polymerization protein, partial [Methylobacterium sp. GXF4]|uniref:polysaccharide pyruvyl transferase family protein n=1 Tax=Methylobacterium sp. GXF4 TaxID=1096546 RepID=UPI0002699A51